LDRLSQSLTALAHLQELRIIGGCDCLVAQFHDNFGDVVFLEQADGSDAGGSRI
jgi:hypothetical protein